MPVFRNALFLPAQERQFWRMPAGLYTPDLRPIPESQCWHSDDSAASAPPVLEEPAEPVASLAGRSLFLGAFSNHFGHLLVETTARFHGFDEGPFDQVLLFTQHGQRHWPVRARMRELFELFGQEKQNLVMPGGLTRLEEVTVPGQGWGSGVLAHGSPEFRSFARRNFAPGVKAAGARALYISRSRHNASRGSLIGEAALERYFEAAGFRIFHPQDHSLNDQIAQYRAADVIVGPDGTPFHLVALAAREEAKILLIQRRITADAGHLLQQLHNFGLAQSEMIPCKPTGWAFAGSRFAYRTLWGETSPPQIREALIRAGVLGAETPDWPELAPEERLGLLEALMRDADCSLCEVTSDQARLRQVARHGPDGGPLLVSLAAR